MGEEPSTSHVDTCVNRMRRNGEIIHVKIDSPIFLILRFEIVLRRRAVFVHFSKYLSVNVNRNLSAYLVLRDCDIGSG